MKFLTEIDVRKMYMNSPFEVYVDEEGTKLTPGARQYLRDKGVKFQENFSKSLTNKTVVDVKVVDNNTNKEVEEKLDLTTKKMLATISAQMLVVASEMLDLDKELAEELFALEVHIKNLIKTNVCVDINSLYKPCNVEFTKEEQEANQCMVLDNLHFKSTKGKEVAKLYYLLCVIKEKQPFENEVVNSLMKCVTGNLGQMICRALRGNLCRKKS